jgi:hypothetical protein
MKAQFDVIEYETWGNVREGSWQFIRQPTGKTVAIDAEEFTNYQINRALKVRGVDWFGEDELLQGTLKRNGKPVMELRLKGE